MHVMLDYDVTVLPSYIASIQPQNAEHKRSKLIFYTASQKPDPHDCLANSANASRMS